MKKWRRLTAVGFSVCAFVTVLAGCGSGGTQKSAESGAVQQEQSANTNAPEEVRILTLAHASSSGPQYDAVKGFAEAVEKDSKGALKIEIKDSGVMGTETEVLDQVRMGAIEMALTGGANHQSIVPETAIEEMPYAFSNNEQAYAAMDGELGDALKALLEEKGVTVLAWWENGFREMTNNVRPINTVEDMKGLKIRSAEVELRLDMFNALGATAIPMAGSEVFTALSQGTVDGQENPLANIYVYKFQEAQKYLSFTHHIWGSYVLEINSDVWKGLTPEEQQILSSNAIKYRDIERDAVRNTTEEYQKLLLDAGMVANEVEDLESFRAACQPVYDKWSKIFGDDLMQKLEKYRQ